MYSDSLVVVGGHQVVNTGQWPVSGAPIFGPNRLFLDLFIWGTFPAFTVAFFWVALQLSRRMACDHGHGSYPELNYGSGKKWIKNLTKDRLGGFNGGHYSDLNLASVLYTQRLDSSEFVKLKV